MTTYSKNVWSQLKGIKAEDLISALRRDGWEEIPNRNATYAFRHPSRPSGHNRIVIHYHKKKEKGPRLIKEILDTIGWDEGDLRRLKLIK